MTLGKVSSLSDFLLFLIKKNYYTGWGRGRSTKPREPDHSFSRCHAPPFAPPWCQGVRLQALGAKGPWHHSPLRNPGRPSGSNVKWVTFDFFKLHPTSLYLMPWSWTLDAPGHLRKNAGVLLTDIARYACVCVCVCVCMCAYIYKAREYYGHMNNTYTKNYMRHFLPFCLFVKVKNVLTPDFTDHIQDFMLNVIKCSVFGTACSSWLGSKFIYSA